MFEIDKIDVFERCLTVTLCEMQQKPVTVKMTNLIQ